MAGLGDERSIALLKQILIDERPTEKWWETKTGRVSWVRAETARALVSTGDDGAIDAVWDEYKRSLKKSTERYKDKIDEINIGNRSQGTVPIFAARETQRKRKDFVAAKMGLSPWGGGRGTGPCFRPTVCLKTAFIGRKMDQSLAAP